MFLNTQHRYRIFGWISGNIVRSALYNSRGTFQIWSSFMNFYTKFWNGAKKNIGRSRQFFSTVCKLHFTCPGLHFGKKKYLEKKTILHNDFQTSRKIFFGREVEIAYCVSMESPEKNELSWKDCFVAFFGLSA